MSTVQELAPHQFKPGHINTGGRKKGRSLKEVFTKVLSYRCTEDLTLLGLSTSGIDPLDLLTLTNEDVIALQVTAKALRGDLAAIAMIHDRIEGKPVQTNHNLNAEVTYADFLEKLAEEDKQAIEALLA